MNEFDFREQIMRLCCEMAKLGKTTAIPFSDLEIIAKKRVLRLTTEPLIAKLMVHLCESVAVLSRHYIGAMPDQVELYVETKVDSIIHQLRKSRGVAS